MPINFRLSPPEIAFILADAGAGGVLAEEGLHALVEEIRDGLDLLEERFVHFGAESAPSGWRSYEALIAAARQRPRRRAP